jgi:hypothetical protein
MKTYINYPEAHFEIHRNHSCAQIQKRGKVNQRMFTVDNTSLGDVLSRFINGEVKFTSSAPNNDAWLDISLASDRHDQAFVYVVHALLGRRYKPFASAPVKDHC